VHPGPATWRVPIDQIPTGDFERITWIGEQWLLADRWIGEQL